MNKRIVLALLSIAGLLGCKEKTNVGSWIGSYYYDICCEQGKISEYWNVLLQDSAGVVTGMLYWGRGGEQASLRCTATGDSLQLTIALNQTTMASAFNNAAVGDVLFRINRAKNDTLLTVWETVRPLCLPATQAKAVYFTTAQPGTAGDPCAGENPNAATNAANEGSGVDLVNDTAQMSCGWNESLKQFDTPANADRLLNGGVITKVSKPFDYDSSYTKISDKDFSTIECFAVHNGGSVTLHVDQPLPAYIVSGTPQSSDAKHHSRIKSITVTWEFETVGHIELQDKPGIQYSKFLDELKLQVPESGGIEITIEGYQNSNEVCIAELF